jgi:hypothetical protein
MEDMMRTTVVLLAVTMLALTSFAGPGAQLSSTDKVKVEAEVRAAVLGFVASVNAVDADKAFAYFSTAPEFRQANNAFFTASRDECVAKYREAYAKLTSMNRTLADEHVDVLSRDLAMYSAGGTFTTTDKAGKTTLPTPIAWTLLWQREPTGWKVINAHQSFVQPAQP